MEILIIIGVFGIFVVLDYYFVPFGNHWGENFYPAIIKLVHFQNPYSSDAHLFYPLWVLFPIIPLAILPARLATAILSSLNIFIYAFVAYKLGAKPFALLIFILLPNVLYNSYNVNFDCMVALGFLLPPQIGLFFVLAKPQAAGLIAVYWAWQAWKTGKWRELFRVFAPVSIAYALSFLAYGLWFLYPFDVIHNSQNLSPWPAAIPVGLVMLVSAIRNKRPGLAVAASPLMTPYSLGYSWAVSILGLLPSQVEFIAAAVGLWIVYIVLFVQNML
jgi:hypothetical protein